MAGNALWLSQSSQPVNRLHGRTGPGKANQMRIERYDPADEALVRRCYDVAAAAAVDEATST